MGKIMLNGVTYSGTIYEAVDEESGGSVVSLPASRVIYDNEVSKLSADSAQNAIDALKELNDDLSEKIPFSLMYNSATQEYGYIDNSGKFIAFSNGGSQEEVNVKVIPSGNGDTEIAQIKINNEYTSIYGYGNSLTYKGNAYSTLPDIDVVDQNTKNQIYIAKGSEGTYTYEKTDEDGNKTEETLNAKVNDMLFSDGKSWSVLFSGGDSIDYTSEISGGTVVGKLNISGTEKDIIIPNATASADDILGTIVFSKDDDGQYGYYKGETFIPFSEGGSSVTISGLLEDGTDIATLNIDGTNYIIKTPSITGVKFEKVNSYAELPNPGEEGTIYLVLKETTSTDNIYTEYIWVVNNEVGAYEMLGDTAVKAVDIAVSADYTEGTKIATITVDENDTNLFIPEDIVELTKAEYDILSDEEKLDKTFFITDWVPDESLGGSYNGPIGEIIAYMGKTAPNNFLICDGSIYNITDYLDLANHINQQFGSFDYFGGDGITTFAVPDLRGEFLRGSGTNSHKGQGNGSSIGTHQDGTNNPYIYADASDNLIWWGNSLSHTPSNFDKIKIDDSNINNGYYANRLTWGSNVTGYYTYTTRPTNTSVLYCIRYREAGKGSNSVNYSLEEQYTGRKWVDGHRIYQKTVKLDDITVTTTMVGYPIINFVDYNIDTIINATGCCIWSGQKWIIPFANTMANILVNFAEFNHNGNLCLVAWRQSGSILMQDIYVTVEYTKLS